LVISAGNRSVTTGSRPVAGRPGFLLALPMVLVLHYPACRSKRRDRALQGPAATCHSAPVRSERAMTRTTRITKILSGIPPGRCIPQSMEKCMSNDPHSRFFAELTDELSNAVCFAHGIEAAINGLEVNDISLHEGVRQLIRTHISGLESLYDTIPSVKTLRAVQS
jgi:hypothetical protein